MLNRKAKPLNRLSYSHAKHHRTMSMPSYPPAAAHAEPQPVIDSQPRKKEVMGEDGETPADRVRGGGPIADCCCYCCVVIGLEGCCLYEVSDLILWLSPWYLNSSNDIERLR